MNRSWQWATAAVCILVLGLTGSALAQSKPLSRKELDQRVYDVLRDVIEFGIDLYNNKKDPAGCFRVYQGSLLTVQPLLDHRPKLQQYVKTTLANVDKQRTIQAKAKALRVVLDNIRAAVAPQLTEAEPKKPEEDKPQAAPLWDRLGGKDGVAKVVDDFIALAAADPKVNFTRGGKFKFTDAQIAELKKQLVAFVSSATGGPIKYTGKSMKEAHQGMGITDAEFDAAAADLKKALKSNDVKAADIDAVLKAVEGTRKDIVEGKQAEGKKVDKTASVQGKITFKGQPLGDGKVRFYLRDRLDKPVASADIGEDGDYEVKELKPGEYVVTIGGGKKPAIPEKFNSPDKSGLTFRVKEGLTNLNIELP